MELGPGYGLRSSRIITVVIYYPFYILYMYFYKSERVKGGKEVVEVNETMLHVRFFVYINFVNIIFFVYI